MGSKKSEEFWDMIRRVAEPMRNAPDWMKGGIVLNPRHYVTYMPEWMEKAILEKIDARTAPQEKTPQESMLEAEAEYDRKHREALEREDAEWIYGIEE